MSARERQPRPRRCADFDGIATSYDRGRALPLEALNAWRDAAAPFVPKGPQAVMLDLGAGTGLFSYPLAGWFDMRVVAVEPSEAMRLQALSKAPDPRVGWVAGKGERIPLRDESCDAVWISTVLDHISDLSRCTDELRRVLRPDGRVLIRDAFADRLDGISLFRFFPEAREVMEATGLRLEETLEAFGGNGFLLESLQTVDQVTAPSLEAFYERVSWRADSSLRSISDEAFRRGMDAIKETMEREGDRVPVVGRLDLVVLRR